MISTGQAYPQFEQALRRIVTADGNDDRSRIIIDAGPSSALVEAGAGGLLEIWDDVVVGRIEPRNATDRGPDEVTLAPAPGSVKVRWFIMEPMPSGIPRDQLEAGVRDNFARIGGETHVVDQSRHPGMHETPSLDIICLLSGRASLILEEGETEILPGQVVIQRGTNHAWAVHGGPALFLGVLIDRSEDRSGAD